MLRVVSLTGCMVVLLLLVHSVPVLAQSPGESFSDGSADVKYFDFFVVKGGPIAFGLIALSVVTFALTIEHCLSIRRVTIVPPQVAQQVKLLIGEKKYVEAIKYTADDPSMLGHILHSGLLEANNGFVAMEHAMEDMLDDRTARLARKTQFLNIIGNVSPMIGLLGTVTGMILLFAEIHAADAFPGARIVADKIAIALITTFWGLAVSIPALSIHAVFRNRIDVLTAECALVAEQILSIFKPGEKSLETKAAEITQLAGGEGHATPA